MYHSITFRNMSGTSYNTWNDWHLIPTSRPTIAHPEMLSTYVTIPGRQGSLNITNYLYSEPIYQDRSGTIEFYVMEGYVDHRITETNMLKFLQGRKMQVIFEDDPGYYYVGRIKLDKWTNEASRPSVSISYIIEPYKYNLSTGAKMLGIF